VFVFVNPSISGRFDVAKRLLPAQLKADMHGQTAQKSILEPIQI
jgi:hypothetical protein